MKSHSEKSGEKTSQLPANGGKGFKAQSPIARFSDNRPETSGRQALQLMADTYSASQSIQLKPASPSLPGQPVVQRMVKRDEAKVGHKIIIIDGNQEGEVTKIASRGYYVSVAGGPPKLYTYNMLDPHPEHKADVDLLRKKPTKIVDYKPHSKRKFVAEVSDPNKRPNRGKKEEEVKEGDGVSFENPEQANHWYDGYCTKVMGNTYEVVPDDKVMKDHFGGKVYVGRSQIITDDVIKDRLGKKREKSSKRDWSEESLANKKEMKEVEGMYSSVTPLLMQNPVALGSLLRTGGHIGATEFKNVGTAMGITATLPTGTKGKSKNKEVGNAIVANDTYAMLATRFDSDKGVGKWQLHGRTKPPGPSDSSGKAPPPSHHIIDEDALKKEKNLDVKGFKDKYIYQQGSIAGEDIQLPKEDKRSDMHAEAKVVKSPTWQRVLQQTIEEFKPDDPKKPEVPNKRKIISLVINRSSCGSKKASGHEGGCNNEVAIAVGAFWKKFVEAYGKEYVDKLRAANAVKIEVSVGGEYEKPGDPGVIATAGATVRTHPTYNYAKDMPEPITKVKYKFMKRLAALEGSKGKAAASLLEQILMAFLASLPPARKPDSEVQGTSGQGGVTGLVNTAHTGRIACTNIAAHAMQFFMHNPAVVITPDLLKQLMQEGTDNDHTSRQAVPVAERDEHYFAHDEVEANVPQVQVNQPSLDNAGPQFLNGVRGDYRRIARHLTTTGANTGLLITIGAATITVVNNGVVNGNTQFALFDSHGRATYETYSSEGALTGAIKELYPPLPNAGEILGVWYATPYMKKP